MTDTRTTSGPLADRAGGVLLGQACGDALGVPYEFATPPGPGELAEMRGGGLGDFAPGEWSDDTAMAVAVAEGLLVGGPLDERLDAIAAGFLDWYDGGPADIGNQTRAVLGAVARRERPGLGALTTEAAQTYAERHPRSAGNGALMRTSPIALAHLDDRDACAVTARAVAGLTHADPLAVDSCVLWSEAIRVAVTQERLDVRAGIDLLDADRRDRWAAWIAEAESGPPSRFRPNGFTVTALQAAWAAIAHTEGSGLEAVLHAAVRIGDDTDTVAAIAGGLVGARWGASSVPATWRSAVHGWPGRSGEDLVALANGLAGAADRAD